MEKTDKKTKTEGRGIGNGRVVIRCKTKDLGKGPIGPFPEEKGS